MNKTFSSPWFAAFGAALLAWSGCSRPGPHATGAPGPVPVQTAVAQREDVPHLLESVGTVQALRTVSVKSQVDGMIAQIHFREGDEVTAGDLLVTLDQRPFQNALRIARADLENARAQAKEAEVELERYRNLDQQAVISKEQFTQLETNALTSRAQVQAKEAAVANAELQLSYTEIRAPISGRTGQLLLHEGALVKANDAASSIVTLNQLTPISVAFAVPENTLHDVRTQLAAGTANVFVADQSNGVRRAQGRLTFVDNSVDPATGTILLKAEFPNADHSLWPGEYVRTDVELGVDRNVIVVPSSAVQVGQDGAQVYVVKADKTVELRPVHVIRTAGDNSLLADGVQGGETVVTDGQLRLVPGAHVEVKALAAAVASAEAAEAKP